MYPFRSPKIATAAMVALSSCATQAKAPASGELQGNWNLRTAVYREDLGCIVRGVLVIADRQGDWACKMEVRETCEVYSPDRFVAARDTCTLETDGADIVLRVTDRKVLDGTADYLKSQQHKLARYELGISSDGRTLSGRYFGDWDAAVRLEKQ